jgi:hypothetical protein
MWLPISICHPLFLYVQFGFLFFPHRTFGILFDVLNGFLFFYFPSTLILEAQRSAAVDSNVVSRSKHRINDDNDSSNGEGDRVAENGKAEESKKVKAKKPKKPKVTVSDAAAKIDADDLSAFLAEITMSFAFQFRN